MWPQLAAAVDQSTPHGGTAILEHKAKHPNLEQSVRIAPNATVCGEVSIGPNV